MLYHPRLLGLLRLVPPCLPCEYHHTSLPNDQIEGLWVKARAARSAPIALC